MQPERRKQLVRVLKVVVPVQVVLASLAWRDLNRRPPEAVRGPKLLWRIAVSVNAGNALAYWVFGRKRTGGGISS